MICIYFQFLKNQNENQAIYCSISLNRNNKHYHFGSAEKGYKILRYPNPKLLVDEKILNNTNNDSRSWLTHGLNYNENRFSQLTKINQNSVKDLALSWSYDLDQMKGVEATPIIANDVMYVTGPWSMVYALDAVTGKKIWQYDPEVLPATLEKACCDAVNRGVVLKIKYILVRLTEDSLP